MQEMIVLGESVGFGLQKLCFYYVKWQVLVTKTCHFNLLFLRFCNAMDNCSIFPYVKESMYGIWIGGRLNNQLLCHTLIDLKDHHP